MLHSALTSLGQGALRVLPDGAAGRLRRRLSAPILTLLYHRVLPEVGEDVNRLAVSCENFAAHLSQLTRSAEVVDQAAFIGLLQHRRRVRKPRVLITFDDGYADNLHHALPILQRFGLTATLFVTSRAVGSNRLFWWDALERVARAASACSVPSGEPTPEVTWPGGPRISCLGGFEATYRRLLLAIKPYPGPRCAEALEWLARRYDLDLEADDSYRPVTWGELESWSAAGMAVGAHTRTHPQLSALSDDELRGEIRGSKQELERGLDGPVRMFAYPFGQREDFDARAEQAARQAGYACAFANWNGNARWSKSRYRLPRCLVRNWSRGELAAAFAGWCR